MKKAAFILLLIVGALHLKAQDIISIRPTDSLINRLKLTPVPFQLKKPFTMGNTVNILASNDVSNIDHMPIAVLGGNYKMPVKIIGGYYSMPVIGAGGKKSLPETPNNLPGLPTFKTP
jgi:hypothetical protein